MFSSRLGNALEHFIKDPEQLNLIEKYDIRVSHSVEANDKVPDLSTAKHRPKRVALVTVAAALLPGSGGMNKELVGKLTREYDEVVVVGSRYATEPGFSIANAATLVNHLKENGLAARVSAYSQQDDVPLFEYPGQREQIDTVAKIQHEFKRQLSNLTEINHSLRTLNLIHIQEEGIDLTTCDELDCFDQAGNWQADVEAIDENKVITKKNGEVTRPYLYDMFLRVKDFLCPNILTKSEYDELPDRKKIILCAVSCKIQNDLMKEVFIDVSKIDTVEGIQKIQAKNAEVYDLMNQAVASILPIFKNQNEFRSDHYQTLTTHIQNENSDRGVEFSVFDDSTAKLDAVSDLQLQAPAFYYHVNAVECHRYDAQKHEELQANVYHDIIGEFKKYNTTRREEETRSGSEYHTIFLFGSLFGRLFGSDAKTKTNASQKYIDYLEYKNGSKTLDEYSAEPFTDAEVAALTRSRDRLGKLFIASKLKIDEVKAEIEQIRIQKPLRLH